MTLSFLLPLARILAAAFVFGLVSEVSLVAALALAAALGAPVAALLAAKVSSAGVLDFLQELTLGALFGLLASVPVIAARLGGALGESRLSAPWKALGAITAGVVLFGAGLDRAIVRALVESFILAPPGDSTKLLTQLSEAPLMVLRWSLELGLRLGLPGLLAALAAELLSAFALRSSPGLRAVSFPSPIARAIGFLAALTAFGFALLQAAQKVLGLL